MTLHGEQVHSELSKKDDYWPDQFKIYKWICSAPIPLSDSASPSIRYWETNSRLQWKGIKLGLYLLEMAVTEGKKNLSDWVSAGNSGWSVHVAFCNTHQGSACIDVWENGRRVGDCLATTPFPTEGKDVQIKLGIVLDVGQGRLAFIDVNNEKILHKFDVTFLQPPYPVFGVWPAHSDKIDMQLVSGGDIAITDSKKSVIKKALFSS